MYMQDVVDTTIQTSMDNHVWYMDIFGSWLEFGMVIAALLLGASFVVVSVRKWIHHKLFLQKEITNFWRHGFEEKHTHIQERLSELRVGLDAGRTIIAQFHNGGHFIGGTTMRRFSITHESCALGVSSSSVEIHDMLVTRYLDLLYMLEHEQPKVWDVSTMEPGPFKNLMESNHVVCFAIQPFRCNQTGLFTGFICVEWCAMDKADAVEDDSAIEKLNSTQRIVGVYLNDD